MILFSWIALGFTYWPIDTLSRPNRIENYILNKHIEYRLGGNGPRYYDCGGIVTEAMRNEGYAGEKIGSSIKSDCQKPLSESKKGDILINTNEGQRHVAFISENNGHTVKILDYVNDYNKSSYREHGAYDGVYALDFDCMMPKETPHVLPPWRTEPQRLGNIVFITPSLQYVE